MAVTNYPLRLYGLRRERSHLANDRMSRRACTVGAFTMPRKEGFQSMRTFGEKYLCCYCCGNEDDDPEEEE